MGRRVVFMTAPTAYERILDALHEHGSTVRTNNGTSAMVRCPSHADASPSLSLRRIEGSLLLHCHAGCDTDDVLAALGLGVRDLYDNPAGARYDYTDQVGTVLRTVHRTPDKRFRQSVRDKSSVPLYRLPEVVKAIGDDQVVYLVEGEKDVHSLEALGIVATTGAQGASNWHLVDSTPLHGGDIRVVVDRDAAGDTWAQAVSESLSGMVMSLEFLQAKAGKDAADHVAAGYGVEDFQPYEPTTAAHSVHSVNSVTSEPIPLTHIDPLPEFPVTALAEPVRSMVEAVAEFTQTDPAMAGTVALGVLSGCAAGRVMVEVRGSWTEPLSIYGVVSAASGTRKSPVFAAMTAPLIEAEHDLVALWKPAAREAEAQKRIANEAARRAERSAASKGGDGDATAEAISASMFADGIDVPTQPRILADDVTPEALAGLLAQHGGRVAVMSAEGGVFDTLAGRYSNGVPNLDTMLKGWSAEPVRVDRRGAPSEYVKNACITMMLTIQPAVLTAIARNGAFRGRGLLARFLFALPPNNVGRRRVGMAAMDTAIITAYQDCIRTLATDLEQWASDPAKLLIAPDAADMLLAYEADLEPRLGPSGDLGVVADWGSKAAGQTIRLAALLHLTKGKAALFERINAATMRDAIALIGYYTEHAKSAFVAMGTDQVTVDAQFVLDHLQRDGVTEFTVRDLHVKLGTNRFPKVDDLKAALELLEGHHWIVAKPQPRQSGAGRPRSPVYLTQFTETHTMP